MKSLMKIFLSLATMLVIVKSQCRTRNPNAANAVDRPCRSSCVLGGRRCRSGRVCVCDHECGHSCINIRNSCVVPPTIPNSSGVRVIRRYANGSLASVTTPPYRYDDVAEYVCKTGYERQFPFAQHFCHSRRSWTQLNKAICTKICQPPNLSVAVDNGMVCGQPCISDPDCPRNLFCECNGHCGRSCVKEDYSKCGRAKTSSMVGRIFGGHIPEEAAWPWQVVITTYQSRVEETFNSLFGGGSLINNKWVLTAAHVFDGIYSSGRSERDIVLSFGLDRIYRGRNIVFPSFVQIYHAAEIIRHSRYSPRTFDYDIALVKIGNKLMQVGNNWNRLNYGGMVNFTSLIRPVCLPCMQDSCAVDYLKRNGLINDQHTEQEKCEIETNWLFQGNDRDAQNNSAVVTGYGHSTVVNPSSRTSIIQPSEHLRQAEIIVKNSSLCNQAHKVMLAMNLPPVVQYTDRMLCGVGGTVERPEGACYGDSGGPLMKEVKNERTGGKCWTQIGVVSWGFGCGQSYFSKDGKQMLFPGYYTNVASLISWIKLSINSEWSSWIDSGSCSVSCGRGTLRQTRTCLNGNTCQGKSSRNVDCSIASGCSLGTWSTWRIDGTCSVTCGRGRIRLRRSCSNRGRCEGEETRVTSCSFRSCPTGWSVWSDSGSCSVSCGEGNIRQTRTCVNGNTCIGENTRTVSCTSSPPCPAWNNWAPVGSCSVTCGRGRRRETRTCRNGLGCNGDSRRSVNCNSGTCRTWSNWTPTGTCSVSCGSGRRRETRRCNNGPGCIGNNARTAPCNSQTCAKCSNWTPISICGLTCGGGILTETRRCNNGSGCIGDNTRTASCNSHICPSWSAWSDSGSCSVSCGEGNIRQTRTCVNGNTCIGENTRTVSCTSSPTCPAWNNWTPVGSCSLTCGSGRRRETRTCRNGPGCIGDSARLRICNTEICPILAWSNWTPITGPCSLSCGGGTLRQTRSCNNGPGCIGDSSRTIPCNSQICPSWSIWSNSGSCSVSCGEGNIRQIRTCVNGNTCIGENTRTVSCNSSPPCPDILQTHTWLIATLSCDLSRGFLCQSKNLCISLEFVCDELADCPDASDEANCGTWSNWTPTTGICSASCGDGRLRETRRCNNGDGCIGNNTRTAPCNSKPCSTWSPWSNSGSCSASCGEGTIRQTRTCLNGNTCEGDSTRAISCPSLPECPAAWSPWSNSGSCSVSCGEGTIQQTRTCLNGNTCEGDSTRAISCPSLPECSTGLSCDSSREFLCQSVSLCIAKAFVCDQLIDCPDASDEANCVSISWSNWTPSGTCSASCGGGTIHETRRCINGPGCIGDSTRTAACNSQTCPIDSGSSCDPSLKFTCQSTGVCISREFVCDTLTDCSDASDEADCDNSSLPNERFSIPTISVPFTNTQVPLRTFSISSPTTQTPELPSNVNQSCDSSVQFMCQSTGVCIPKSFVCDTLSDCSDHSDEASCD